MKLNYRNEELERRLSNAGTFEELRGALQAIIKLVPELLNPASGYGSKLFCAELDTQITRLAPRVGGCGDSQEQ
jgi:hypothetical protein